MMYIAPEKGALLLSTAVFWGEAWARGMLPVRLRNRVQVRMRPSSMAVKWGERE
jgi:hypothetical protein